MINKEKDYVQPPDPNQSHTPKATRQVVTRTNCKNLDQLNIEVTEDKLLLILERYWPRVDRWKGLLANLANLLISPVTLATVTFHDVLGFNKEFWKAFYIWYAIFSLVGFVVHCLWVVKARKFLLPTDIVGLIKNCPDAKDTDWKAEVRGEFNRNRKRSPLSRSPSSSLRWEAFKHVIQSFSATK